MIDLAMVDGDGPFRDAVDLIDIEWVDPRLGMAGLLRTVVQPESGCTWFLSAVCQREKEPVVVLAYDLPLVTHAFEFRGPGIWADIACEEAAERWTVGLEAFGLAVDPSEVVTPNTFGDRVALGLDLDVETSSGVELDGGGLMHEVVVAGEVLVGSDAFEIDAVGVRRRRWDDCVPVLTAPTPGIEVVGRLAVRWPGLASAEIRGWVLGNRPGWVGLAA